MCSKDTVKLVDEHISECDECRKELEEIGKEIEMPTIKAEDNKVMERIASVWKKERLKSFVKGAVIATIICAMIFVGYRLLTGPAIIPVSSYNLEVSQVSQLPGGGIAYHLDVKDNTYFSSHESIITDDGGYYKVPKQSIIKVERDGNYNNMGNYYIFDIDETNAYQLNHGDGIEITSYYIGHPDDAILIWEEGMEIPVEYDPLIAKLVVFANSRSEAMARMKRAINEYQILGVKNTLDFGNKVMNDPDFQSGNISTDFVSRKSEYLMKSELNEQEMIAATIVAHEVFSKDTSKKFKNLSNCQNNWRSRLNES